MTNEHPESGPGLTSILEGLDFGVVLIDRDLKILWINAPMERLIGARKGEVQGLDIFTFMKDHVLPRVVDGGPIGERILTSIAAGTSVHNIECQMVSPSGAPYWVEYTGQVIEQGPFRGMRLDFYQDVTLKVLLQRGMERHLGHLGEVIEGQNAELSKLGERLRSEIGERVRAEQELLRERDFRANLINNAPAFFIVLDGEMRILLMNRAILQILGHGEEVAGMDFIESFIPAGERQRVRGSILRSLETGDSFVAEYPVVSRDGREIPCEWHHCSIKREDGTLEYHLMVGIDISGRREMEGALRRSEALYRAIFESTLAPTLIVRGDGTISRANAEFSRVYGYEAEALTGRRIQDLFPPEERGSLVRTMELVRAGSKISAESSELRFIDSGGQLRDVILNAARIPECEDIVISLLDITDRKNIERAREENSRYLYILNQLITAAGTSKSLEEGLDLLLERAIELLALDAGAIYLIEKEKESATLKNLKGMPEWMERAARKIRTDREPFRTPFAEGRPHYLDREVTGLFSAAIIPLLSDGRTIGILYAISGSRDRFSTPEQRILESISSEIGGLIHRGILQRELAEMNEQANLYLDIMVHDINNANTVALMYTELLSEGLDQEREELARKLQTSIRRSIRTIENVSMIRRIRGGEEKLSRYRLEGVIRKAIEGFPNARIAFESTEAMVMADDLLEEVFINLIENSLKFGGPDTEIAIRVRALDGEVEVSVEDNGPGIPDQLKSVIFRRFERADKKGVRGSGLGLYICRMLIERYGGTIRAEDRIPGESKRGTAIRFTLKRAHE